MLLAPVVLALLASTQATAASSDLNPFSWRAAEDAETRTAAYSAAHLVNSAGADERLRETVFAPKSVVDHEAAECSAPGEQVRPSADGVPLVLFLLAVPAAFCFGWVSGVRHSLSQQALERARAEDQAAIETAIVAATTATAAQNVLPHDSSSQANGAQPPVPRVDSLSSVGSDSGVLANAIPAGQVRMSYAYLANCDDLHACELKMHPSKERQP